MGRLSSILNSGLSLEAVDRITASLEGDWSANEVEVWRRDGVGMDLSKVVRRHAVHRPSLELHSAEVWIGVRCFARLDGENVLDEELAREIVCLVEAAVTRGSS